MKEMSLQQAVEFWTYLHNQAELKKQAFINTPSGSPYRDEVRAEGETYQAIANRFAENFGQPLTSAKDILHGLTSDQAAGFLDYLDKRTAEVKEALEKTRRNRQEALTRVQDIEYHKVKNIYNEMENLDEDQIIAFQNSLKSFIRILQES